MDKVKRVLVIDDEKPILMMMEDLLEILGFEMTGVMLGQEGLDKIKKEEYSIIVCDLSLPDMDGRDFFTKAIEENPEIKEKFIFSSGFSEDKSIKEFCENHSIRFLSKPFKIEDIQKLIS